MKVALPVFNDTVAPCFEVARRFLLASIQGREVVSEEVVVCRGCEGFGRVQLIRDHKVAVLICNGVKAFYRDLLQAAGVDVIAGVSSTASEALSSFCTGQLALPSKDIPPVDLTGDIPLEDLICWTHELFSAHGYKVELGAETAPFPIDMIAEIACPVCHRQVRVAVCCGAHAYRPDQEIQALHLAAAAGYSARVYVHTGSPDIELLCNQYGIELIDPDARFARRDHPDADHIPVLQQMIPGHERASQRQQ